MTWCNVLKPSSASLGLKIQTIISTTSASVIEVLAIVLMKYCRVAGKQYTSIHCREL